LARLWLGPGYGQPNVNKAVKIKIPEPTKEGIVETSAKEDDEKKKPKIEEFAMPETEEEARDIIRRFEKGAEDLRGDEDVSDSVAQHALTDRTNLLDEKWLGTEEEERAS
jgi:phospholipase D1/2